MQKTVKFIVTIIAIIAVVILTMQIVEWIHMVIGMTHLESEGSKTSLIFDSNGFCPWFPFIEKIESWWSWATKILSVVVLILFAKSKKQQPSEDWLVIVSLSYGVPYWEPFFIFQLFFHLQNQSKLMAFTNKFNHQWYNQLCRLFLHLLNLLQ